MGSVKGKCFGKQRRKRFVKSFDSWVKEGYIFRQRSVAPRQYFWKICKNLLNISIQQCKQFLETEHQNMHSRKANCGMHLSLKICFYVPGKKVHNWWKELWELFCKSRILCNKGLCNAIFISLLISKLFCTNGCASNILQPWSKNRPYGIWGKGVELIPLQKYLFRHWEWCCAN